MAYLESDSYTTLSRVEGLTRRGPYTDTPLSTPSRQEVLDRMAQQAARITAVLRLEGHAGTVPTGVDPLTDSTLLRLCDEANTFLAAAYGLEMHDVKDTEMGQFRAYIEAAEALLEQIAEYVRTTLTTPTHSGRAFVSDPEYAIEDLMHLEDMRP